MKTKDRKTLERMTKIGEKISGKNRLREEGGKKRKKNREIRIK
jgi:hypothetical protein